ncbi:MAG: ribosome-associated translation inhibitor RaiA [Alphaproteobacteria bacterium]|nr:ribosome-associated translation inhibitor RaiA [Alphaproteobacteria bacterium]
MQITITGKQLHLGDNMQTYAENNLSAVVEKYFDDAVNASALFSKEGDLIKAEVSVHPASGALLKGSAQGSDAYAAFDQACERIATQLRRYKNRLAEHKNEKFEMVDISVIESEDEEELTTGTAPVIIAEMQTELPICSVSGAVMRMDLADLPALMFRNSAHGGLNMVYRRPDGNIGWVDPKTKG